MDQKPQADPMADVQGLIEALAARMQDLSEQDQAFVAQWQQNLASGGNGMMISPREIAKVYEVAARYGLVSREDLGARMNDVSSAIGFSE